MANHVTRDVVSETSSGFFSIICDEYTDISNKEQLTICNVNWLNGNFKSAAEGWRFFVFGRHNTEN